MEQKARFSKNLLKLNDIDVLAERIISKIRSNILDVLKRNGGVLGISGGIDSSVCLALTTRALGHENVIGIMMPERDSSPDSIQLAKLVAEKEGISEPVIEDITDALQGYQCYQRRDEAVCRVFPEYNPGLHKIKIGLNQQDLGSGIPPVFVLTIEDKNGWSEKKILSRKDYLQITSASNFKQRARMSMLYYYAEMNHFAVIGTANKHEIKQGFFVKHGDGGADIMPIGEFYKTQVFQLAEYLDIPGEIIKRIPTTDTYSANQTQEEFFYQMPFEEMDLYWYGYENNYEPAEVAEVMGDSEDRVERIFSSFERKVRTTEYLRTGPLPNE